MASQTVLHVIARAAGLATILLGLSTVLGEMPLGQGIDRILQRLEPGMGDMTSMGMTLAGAALFILGGRASSRFRAAAAVLALLVAAIGIMGASQHLFERETEIEEILLGGRYDQPGADDRSVSTYAAVSFAAIGLALVALPWARLRPAVWLLSACSMVVGMVSLLGHLWGSASEPVPFLLVPVSLPAAFGFTLLGIGTWLASSARHPSGDPPVYSRTTIEIQVISGLALSIVLLLAGVGVTYQASGQAARTSRWIADNQAARALLAAYYTDLLSAESAARNHLLTGAPAQRDAFAYFVASAQANGGRLSARVADDPVLTDLLGRLKASETSRLDQLLTAMQRRGTDAGPAVAAGAPADVETSVMADIREPVLAIDERIGTRLLQVEARTRVDRQKALFSLDLALLFAVGIFLFLLYHIRREMLARAGSDERVRRLNAALERRVESDGLALGAEQRRLSDMFDRSHDALLMIDGLGAVMQMNRQAEVLFGHPRSALVGAPIATVLPGEAGGRPRERTLSPAHRRPDVPDERLQGVRSDGSVFPVEVSFSTLGTGPDLVTMAAVRDVTERERMTAALKDSAALYRHTLDNMLEGCRIVSFDWVYLYVNAAAALQIRQPVEHLIGRSIKDAHPGYAAQSIAAGNKRCMTDRVAVHAESEVVYPDGSIGWFRISHLPAPEGMAVFSVDISERKKAEAENLAIRADLEQRVSARTAELELSRAAAQAASVAKSSFLAAMSHEIRTPMNGVIGMVDVLAHSAMPDDQADAVRTIRTSAFALLGIIDDILDFSKIEADRLDLEHAPLRLHDLIESVCSTLLPLAVDKGVELDLFVAPDVPSQLWSDSTRLRQILFNLLGNAIKFSGGRTATRGRVCFHVELAADDPQRLLIRLEDNGIGMSEQTLSQLFIPFVQAEASTTRRFGGTGLGLTITRRLVELMGGTIAVESREGEGSVFVVSLPVERVEGALQDAQPDLRGLDVVVAGQGEQAQHLSIYLVHAGASVHRQPDEAAAVACSRALPRSVVVHTDLRDQMAEELLAPFAGGDDVRHVLIARGLQAKALQSTANAMALEGNCLSRAVFLSAVAVAAGRESPRLLRERLDGGLGSPPEARSVAEARARGQLILVAEDDAINQKVILRQIELLGYAAEIAHDGAEALRLWKAGPYALLLTDLHMPEMDGYALAKAIRSAESIWDPTWTGTGAGSWIGSGESRMPIVALTANAIRGEAARAREAGMDEYLTKPLQLHLLKASLQQWIPDVEHDTVAGDLGAGEGGYSADVIDARVLPSFVGDDPAVIRQFMADFRGAVARLGAELRGAHATHDHVAIGAVAHKLKSSCRTVGAIALGDACASLENVSRGGSIRDVARCMATFESAVAAVHAHPA